MKKLFYSYWSLLLAASLLITTSCGTDEEDGTITPGAPAFTITGTDDVTGTTVDVGEPVSFTVNVTAPGGFNVIRVQKTVGETGTPEDFDEESRPSGQTTESYAYDFSYTPTAEEAGQAVYFDFVAVDDAGLSNTYEYIITVNEAQLISYEEELLYAPLGNNTSQTWFSTSTGETYSSAQVNESQETISADIDFGYFYGVDEFGPTIASVANYPIAAGQGDWSASNATLIKKTELEASAFFEASSAATVQQAYDAATFEDENNQGRATNLEVGDVLVFMTDPNKEGGSKMGLIHVSEIVEGAGTEGRILINVKVAP